MQQFSEYLTVNYSYVACSLLMLIGFFTVVNSHNLIKKLMGISIFQTSVLIFYISASYIDGGSIPILKEGVKNYVNPLPHVLMLTAIVVGVATLAVGLALAIKIKEEYGTIEDDEILKKDLKSFASLEKSEIDS